MILDLKTKVDKLGIEDRVSRITKRSLKSEAKLQGLKMILSMIDLTTLEGMDTIKRVEQLCYKAIHLHQELPELPNVAAVCVYPNMVKTASKFSTSLVSGDGGDELFGGYTFRYQKFLSNFNSEMSPLDRVKLYLECHERDWVPDQIELFDSKANFSWDKIYSKIIPYFDN